MREKLVLKLQQLEHNHNTPIDTLLINGEEVELYFSGKDELFWITNKRIVIAYKAKDEKYYKDYRYLDANRYETFQFMNIFSFSVDIIDDANFNVLNIDFINEFQLQILIDKVMPIAEIAQVLTSKILME